MVVHGDDFIIEGAECNLRWVEAMLRKKYVEKVLNDMELGECKESVVPGTKTNEQEDDNEQLDVEYA